MREKDIEMKLKRETEKRGGLCWKFLSSEDGVPDRILLLLGGRTAFAEIKAKGKRPRPLQVRQMVRLKNLGFQVYVLDDEAKISELLNETEWVAERQRQAEEYMAWFLPAWEQLDEDEQYILDSFFVIGDKDAVFRVGEHFDIEKNSVYKKRKRALRHLTLLLYGKE